MRNFFSIVVLGFASALAYSVEPPIDNKEYVSLNFCRPSSLIRSGHTPDLVLNEQVVAEIPNGSNQQFAVKLGDKYLLTLKSNALMMRFKDEHLFKGEVASPQSRYLVVRGQMSSPSAVAATFFGGAIGESIRQNLDETSSQNWLIEDVSQDAYAQACP